MLLTKREMRARIQRTAEEHGGALAEIGGDCYAAVVEGEVRALVALKELTAQDERTWVGWPPPIIDALLGERRIHGSDGTAPHPARANILVAELTSRTLVLIPIPTVVRDSLTRRRANRQLGLRQEFTMLQVGHKRFVVQSDPMHPDVPLEFVDEDALRAIETFIGMPHGALEGVQAR